MNGTLAPALATRLEKVAIDNGFDLELARQGAWLAFASSQAPLRIWLTAADDLLCVSAFSMAHVAAGLEEFGETFDPPLPEGATAARVVAGFADLHRLVRRAFQLSRTLPDALLHQFERRVSGLPRSTEIERLVVQRVGQEVFREGLLEFWQGRCAISGLAVAELLRASHIKPWAACDSDAERLDIFNGLLLSANLDAAFDCGLITVDDDGKILIADGLGDDARRAIGLEFSRRIPGITAKHAPYLAFHRSHVFRHRVAVKPDWREPDWGERLLRASSPADGDWLDADESEVTPRRATGATRFLRYIGVDYSGAKTPTTRLPGLRVYVAEGTSSPCEVLCEGRYWTRKELASWLVRTLSNGPPTIVGIDHAFSFPVDYFSRHGLVEDWSEFLRDFCYHWATDRDDAWIREMRNDPGSLVHMRRGETTWRRLTERRAGAAKSVFHFGVQGEVATSTHAGLPWLRYIRERTSVPVHFWPFDGWDIPNGHSAVVEVYPSLWRRHHPAPDLTGDQQDAYAVAARLRDADNGVTLDRALMPGLTDAERHLAQVEGWILGVP